MTTKVHVAFAMLSSVFLLGCVQESSDEPGTQASAARTIVETKEYFHLRPEVEKAYGYTHAVKIGHADG